MGMGTTSGLTSGSGHLIRGTRELRRTLRRRGRARAGIKEEPRNATTRRMKPQEPKRKTNLMRPKSPGESRRPASHQRKKSMNT